jgi:hypothetical protein
MANLEFSQLESSRRVGAKWPPVGRQSPARKGVNTEAEDATALEAVTRRQPVKIQQTEKTWCVL